MASRRVKLYDIQTDEVVREFESVKECAAYLGVQPSLISLNISGKTKSLQRKYYCKPDDRIFYKQFKETNPTSVPKPIDVYRGDEFIGTYDDVKLAANATGVHPHTIYNVCRGNAKRTLSGYRFEYNLQRWSELKRVPVDLYDVETNELFKSFDDIKECADFLGLSPQTIRQNLRGDIKTVKNWSFYCKSKKYE